MNERLELAGVIEQALGESNNGNLNKFVADQVLAAGYHRGEEDALVRIADQVEQVAMELFTASLIAYRASGQALVGEVESLNDSMRERLGLS